MYPTAPPTNLCSLNPVLFRRVLSITANGSSTFSLSFSSVLLLWVIASPFLIVSVNSGLNPINEYCDSFLGPSIDSRIYAFSYLLYSFAKTSRGDLLKDIFLIFSCRVSRLFGALSL